MTNALDLCCVEAARGEGAPPAIAGEAEAASIGHLVEGVRRQAPEFGLSVFGGQKARQIEGDADEFTVVGVSPQQPASVTQAALSALVVCSLLPQMSATRALLTVGMPRSLSMRRL